MKNFIATFTLFAFLVMSAPSVFAWSYEGPNSLNPFTGFQQCNKCYKVKEVKCKKPKLTKCQKLNGVKLQKGEPCGCAAPIEMIQICPTCTKAF